MSERSIQLQYYTSHMMSDQICILEAGQKTKTYFEICLKTGVFNFSDHFQFAGQFIKIHDTWFYLTIESASMLMTELSRVIDNYICVNF